jgi:hypothetical protein
VSTPITPGSPDWLRLMAACEVRCTDHEDAASLEAAADRIERLERENAVTRKDRERLDWLSSYASSHRYPWGVAWGFSAPSHSQDLREAIDATRTKDTQP